MCVGGHPREVGWTVTPSEEKDCDKKIIYYSYFLTCSVEFFGFFLLFSSSSTLLLQLSILLALRNPSKLWSFFLSLIHIFYCCYKHLALCWCFAVLWSYPFFSSIPFLNFNILNLLYFFLYLFLCLLFLLLFSPCS